MKNKPQRIISAEAKEALYDNILECHNAQPTINAFKERNAEIKRLLMEADILDFVDENSPVFSDMLEAMESEEFASAQKETTN